MALGSLFFVPLGVKCVIMKRFIYTLALAAAVILCGCERENNDGNDPTNSEGQVFVSALRTTDTTATIAWTTDAQNATGVDTDYTIDATHNYRVAIYRTAECTRSSLVVSYESISGAAFGGKQPRFIFTELTPATEYYIKVFDLTGKGENSEPVKITTAATATEAGSVVVKDAAEGSLILFQDFSTLSYGGDISYSAMGVAPKDLSSLKQTTPLRSKQVINSDSALGFALPTDELMLYSDMKGIIDDFGIESWGYIGEKGIFAHPGYLRLVAKDDQSSLCTPLLTAIMQGKEAQLKVVFKAATATTSDGCLRISALAGASISSSFAATYTREVSSESVTITGRGSEDWREYSVTLSGVLSGSTVALCCTNGSVLIDDVKVYVMGNSDVPPVSGKVTDQSGKGVAGVAVSDGYNVVKTDNDGNYSLPYNDKAEFIFYTTPAEYQITTDSDGYPAFFKAAKGSDHNFVLGEKIDKQSKWHLVVMADPQTNQTGKNCIPYFSNYMAADIQRTMHNTEFCDTKDNRGNPVAYGIVLGDVIWNSAVTSYMSSMRSAMATNNTNVSWFTVPGNHDWYASDSDKNPSLDVFHSVFGPDHYSFDRGDIHVVGMNNTMTGSGRSPEEYGQGFSPDEFNYLKADLALVPKDKCVVLCVHIPFFDGEVGVRHCNYYKETLELLKQYKNAYILSGHNHYARHWFHTSYNNVHEMNHGAACGLYWNLKLCGDGTPAGYYIYTFEGNDCADMIFKAAGTESIADGGNALRMYLGNDSHDAYMLCTYGKDSKTVYINLYNGHLIDNADPSPLNGKWKVELLYKGSKVMDMVNVVKGDNTYGYHNMPSDYSSNYSTWKYENNFLRNDADWWLLSQGLPSNAAIKNRNGNKWGGALTNSGYKKTTTHIFAGSLPESVTLDSRDVMVRATTPSGRVYEVTEFTRFSSIEGLAWEKY